ncbi:hypothetical protein D3C87_1600750 [compost metagenome]
MAARTETEQADIHQRQTHAGDEPGDDRISGDQCWRLDAAGTDGVDDDDAEHQGAQGIHGQVTIDEALGERCCNVFRGGVADVTGRQSECSDAQHGERDDLQRREEASNSVQQTPRIQRNEEHQQEVHRAVEEQRQGALAGQWRQTHFERYGRCTRCREQRADR